MEVGKFISFHSFSEGMGDFIRGKEVEDYTPIRNPLRAEIFCIVTLSEQNISNIKCLSFLQDGFNITLNHHSLVMNRQ